MKDLIIVVLVGYIIVSHIGAAIVYAWIKKEAAMLKAKMGKKNG